MTDLSQLGVALCVEGAFQRRRARNSVLPDDTATRITFLAFQFAPVLSPIEVMGIRITLADAIEAGAHVFVGHGAHGIGVYRDRGADDPPTASAPDPLPGGGLLGAALFPRA